MTGERRGDSPPGPPSALETLYSQKDVARLTGATLDQLRRWNRTGLLPARSQESGGLWYAFPDVVAARTAIDLIGQGVTARQVREAVETVRDWRPDLAHPLAALRLFSDRGKLVLRLEGDLVEPRSGQLMLDLPVAPLIQAAGKVIAVRPVAKVEPAREPVDAEGWLEAGLRAEECGDPEAAERAYRKALACDPTYPGALLNLGNLIYARGKTRPACELYRAATRAAPDYPQAWYNLANALDDLGHADAAVRAYATALELDPGYADAHFNLALLWEKQGQREQAGVHWRAYLQLDPDSPSASVARRFLQAPQP
ncbi:MAG: tetratricopeptide repeat protein [Myxococcales bacterium]|nr:tetratricopeptide repeat protein [Myxococcales bacterium]